MASPNKVREPVLELRLPEIGERPEDSVKGHLPIFIPPASKVRLGNIR